MGHFFILFGSEGTILKVEKDSSEKIFNNVFRTFSKIESNLPVVFSSPGLTDLGILRSFPNSYFISFELFYSKVISSGKVVFGISKKYKK